MMYGAIAGDIIGSTHEFDRGPWSRDFELFTPESHFTDDTIMTIAIAKALKLVGEHREEDNYKKHFTREMQLYGRMYPDAGYGANFINWIFSVNPTPYNSFGNGSAMRVSSIGWAFDDLDKTRDVARWSAEVSHNHPEGIKGAEAIATAIWMARNGFKKEDISMVMDEIFDYDLTWSVNELIPLHKHDESCMDSVPKALIAFLEGKDFESVIRNAVAMGGDTDTIAAIAGSVAEAFYGVPKWIKDKCDEILGSVLLADVIDLEV